MITRLSYQFTWGGRTFRGIGVDIGSTDNPEWFKEEGGKGKRFHKWGAIFEERPDVCNAISNYFSDAYVELNPSDFGFRFQELSESEG